MSDSPPQPGQAEPADRKPEGLAQWLGINRVTLGVLVSIGGLGLSEEIWRNFFALELKQVTGSILAAAGYMAVFSSLVNLMEGFAYIAGGALAHRLGARATLALSALPMFAGFLMMLFAPGPWWLVAGAILVSNRDPLSVPSTFDVVGSAVPENRRTIAFAVQSIQKRLPKLLGPQIGMYAFAVAYWLNIQLAFGILGISLLAQLFLLRHLKPVPGASVPLKQVLSSIPPGLRQLLNAEILLRWGDWFLRDYAALYVAYLVSKAGAAGGEIRVSHLVGNLLTLQALTALVTYIPMGKLIDASASPKPWIGLTFFLFALFPFSLVLLPKWLPLVWALSIAFALNGLREIGEPARKALIASGLPKETRARAIGLYWGLRSFAFFPAPIVAYLLWKHIGPENTFLIGGGLGLLGTAWFFLRVRVPARKA